MDQNYSQIDFAQFFSGMPPFDDNTPAYTNLIDDGCFVVPPTPHTRADSQVEASFKQSPEDCSPTASLQPTIPRKRSADGGPVTLLPRRTESITPSIDGTSEHVTPAGSMSPPAAEQHHVGPTGLKKYDLPPRPKPGRKPATDKPCEKRKAQNREAQRAFRERKVAHTTELKDDVEKLKSENKSFEQEVRCLEHDKKELLKQLDELKEENAMKDEVLAQKDDMNAQLMEKLQAMENRYNAVEQEMNDCRRVIGTQGDLIKSRRWIHNNGVSGYMPNVLPGPHKGSPITPPSVHSPMGCGNCEPNGRCACVDQFTVENQEPTVNGLEYDVADALTSMRQAATGNDMSLDWNTLIGSQN